MSEKKKGGRYRPTKASLSKSLITSTYNSTIATNRSGKSIMHSSFNLMDLADKRHNTNDINPCIFQNENFVEILTLRLSLGLEV